jgi:hypothetical protein
MMKLSGGSGRYGHELSLQEFMAQSQRYQNLDEDGLNQIYKWLIYNGGQGMLLSHPFPVERVTYLQEWHGSQEYQRIRRGDYATVGTGAVEVETQASATDDSVAEAERLRREVERLQAEIARRKAQSL